MTAEAKLHDWRIDPKQYARQEARRGRRHAYEYLDSARTALVVVDVIPFFVNENPYCRAIVPNISRLADHLRSAGGLVAWVFPGVWQPSEVEIEFLGADVAKMFAESAGEGTLKEKLRHELDVYSEDVLVEKFAASVFFPGRCELPQRLTAQSIDTVLITNVCCESSARDASTLGHRVIMVADANVTVDDDMHNATLRTIYRTFGDVRSTEEVLALIEAASTSVDFAET